MRLNYNAAASNPESLAGCATVLLFLSMGASYVNILCNGPSQVEIGHALARSYRWAIVTPTIDGISVVCDSELTIACDYDYAAALAESLSATLRCVTMLSYVFDSDIFLYSAYSDGEGIDWYNSRPDYGSPAGKRPPAGGDAPRLCAAFGIRTPHRVTPDCTVVVVDRILRAHAPIENPERLRGYACADERHLALLNALGLPTYAAYSGFEMHGCPGSFTQDDMYRVGRRVIGRTT